MELSVKDRLLLGNLLPQKGDILTLRIVRELHEKLGLSEDELKAINFKIVDNRGTWDTKVATLKNIEIGPAALEVIKKTLTDLEAKKELTLEYLDIYDKVMEHAKQK